MMPSIGGRTVHITYFFAALACNESFLDIIVSYIENASTISKWIMYKDFFNRLHFFSVLFWWHHCAQKCKFIINNTYVIVFSSVCSSIYNLHYREKLEIEHTVNNIEGALWFMLWYETTFFHFAQFGTSL